MWTVPEDRIISFGLGYCKKCPIATISRNVKLDAQWNPWCAVNRYELQAGGSLKFWGFPILWLGKEAASIARKAMIHHNIIILRLTSNFFFWLERTDRPKKSSKFRRKTWCLSKARRPRGPPMRFADLESLRCVETKNCDCLDVAVEK